MEFIRELHNDAFLHLAETWPKWISRRRESVRVLDRHAVERTSLIELYLNLDDGELPLQLPMMGALVLLPLGAQLRRAGRPIRIEGPDGNRLASFLREEERALVQSGLEHRALATADEQSLSTARELLNGAPTRAGRDGLDKAARKHLQATLGEDAYAVLQTYRRKRLVTAMADPSLLGLSPAATGSSVPLDPRSVARPTFTEVHVEEFDSPRWAPRRHHIFTLRRAFVAQSPVDHRWRVRTRAERDDEDDTDDPGDQRGRAAAFVIPDAATGSFELVPNPSPAELPPAIADRLPWNWRRRIDELPITITVSHVGAARSFHFEFECPPATYVRQGAVLVVTRRVGASTSAEKGATTQIVLIPDDDPRANAVHFHYPTHSGQDDQLSVMARTKVIEARVAAVLRPVYDGQMGPGLVLCALLIVLLGFLATSVGWAAAGFDTVSWWPKLSIAPDTNSVVSLVLTVPSVALGLIARADEHDFTKLVLRGFRRRMGAVAGMAFGSSIAVALKPSGEPLFWLLTASCVASLGISARSFVSALRSRRDLRGPTAAGPPQAGRLTRIRRKGRQLTQWMKDYGKPTSA